MKPIRKNKSFCRALLDSRSTSRQSLIVIPCAAGRVYLQLERPALGPKQNSISASLPLVLEAVDIL